MIMKNAICERFIAKRYAARGAMMRGGRGGESAERGSSLYTLAADSGPVKGNLRTDSECPCRDCQRCGHRV